MIAVDDPDFTLHHGNVLDVLPTLDAESVDCVVTSPPYWGLRDYGVAGQLGLEPIPDEYVASMVAVFREVRRVLRPAGTLWLNIGDSYGAGTRTTSAPQTVHSGDMRQKYEGRVQGIQSKQLVGIPWRLAFALQADGWYLRSEIIWAKPNPMPESVTDRPTKAHEQLFLLSKRPRYWYDADAIREPHAAPELNGKAFGSGQIGTAKGVDRGGWGNLTERIYNPTGRNARTVWEIATEPYPDAHFATFPTELARRCILAGCPEQVCGTCGKARERIVEVTYGPDRSSEWAQIAANGVRTGGVGKNFRESESQTVGWSDCGHGNYRPGIVLDPFLGSGTVAWVARHHGRRSIGVELSADYCDLAARRMQQLSLLAEGAACR